MYIYKYIFIYHHIISHIAYPFEERDPTCRTMLPISWGFELITSRCRILFINRNLSKYFRLESASVDESSKAQVPMLKLITGPSHIYHTPWQPHNRRISLAISFGDISQLPELSQSVVFLCLCLVQKRFQPILGGQSQHYRKGFSKTSCIIMIVIMIMLVIMTIMIIIIFFFCIIILILPLKILPHHITKGHQW